MFSSKCTWCIFNQKELEPQLTKEQLFKLKCFPVEVYKQAIITTPSILYSTKIIIMLHNISCYCGSEFIIYLSKTKYDYLILHLKYRCKKNPSFTGCTHTDTNTK